MFFLLLIVQRLSVGEEKAHMLSKAIGFLQVQLDVEGPLRVQYRRPTNKRTGVGVRISTAKSASLQQLVGHCWSVCQYEC